MANVARLGGFTPVKHLNGSPYNGQFNLYEIVAGDAGETDALESVADGGALLGEPGGIAGDIGFLHRLLQEIDDVVGLRVGVVRDFL